MTADMDHEPADESPAARDGEMRSNTPLSSAPLSSAPLSSAHLLIIPQAELPAGYHCQILSFLRHEWPDGFVGENRLRDWISNPAHSPVCYMLVEAGLLIAHAQVVRKSLSHAGVVYNTWGLTGVFTYPSFRGQGYGLAVVRAATEAIMHSGADIGMFHCAPHLTKFYARAGWLPLPGAVTYAGETERYLVRDEIMMMLFLSERGKNARAVFEREPVYFDEDATW